MESENLAPGWRVLCEESIVAALSLVHVHDTVVSLKRAGSKATTSRGGDLPRPDAVE